MNLQETINAIKSQILLQENAYLRRRIKPIELKETFQDAINYCLIMYKRQGKNNVVTLEQFTHAVISMMIDDFHSKLIDDKKDFPYQDIFNYLHNLFYHKIQARYISEFT